MRVRTAFGLGWSVILGVAGGWLVLSPWALGDQGSGDWSTVTRTEVGSGLGLILLALIGIGLVVADVVGWMRASGLVRERAYRGQAPGPTTSAEMEKALLELAQSLARDMQRDHAAQTPVEQPYPTPGAAGWRDQR
jgi:hypothetical protein